MLMLKTKPQYSCCTYFYRVTEIDLHLFRLFILFSPRIYTFYTLPSDQLLPNFYSTNKQFPATPNSKAAKIMI